MCAELQRAVWRSHCEGCVGENMNTIIKSAAALVAGAALILTLAGPAGATSYKTIQKQLAAIGADAHAVPRAADVLAACTQYGDDVATAQTATRPKWYPKAAWRTYQLALSAYADAAGSCQAEDWPTTTAKLATGNALMKAANRAMKG
jgi:hypothetical protein